MENINGHIYLLVDKRNDKKYVGKHNGKKDNYFTSGIIPNRIIRKFGKDIFERIIIEDNILTEEMLSIKEIYYIEKYDTFNNGYNLTKGGDGGGHWIYKKTKEEKLRISEIKRNANIGRIFTEETLRKMSEAKKGKPLTEDHKKKISKSQSGENHPWYGRKHSIDTKLKMSNSRIGIKNPKHSEFMKKNNPRCLEVSINNVIFVSIKEASEKLNLPRHVVKTRLNSLNYPEWIKIKKL